jgi:hypothetical protein
MTTLREALSGSRGAWPLFLAGVCLFAFYLWTASAGLSLGLGGDHDQPYDLLARALVRGQLHLLVAPRPELFELTEPYEPGRNGAYRLHDASLYHGRYYLYFGVVPALLAFAPWRLLGLGDLPQPVAATAFALAALVFGALLLRRLLRAHLPGTSPAAEFLAFGALGLANVSPFLLRGSHVYEVAIAAGAAAVAAAAWLFTTAATVGGLSPGRLALGGLFLGLAVGCRPNLLLLAPVLPLLALTHGLPDRARARLRAALAVTGPLLVCFLGLGLYNHARFGSWTEFGARYQLAGVRPIAWFEWRGIVPTLFYHFLAPPSLRLDFPFVYPDYVWRGSVPEGYFMDPSSTGALAHSPFLLVLLALPWILRGAPVRDGEALRRRLLVLVAGGLVVPLVTSFVFASAAMRFQGDFIQLLLVPALVLWFVLAARARERWRGRFRALAAAVFGWSAFAAVALSLIGASNDLHRLNPALFASLERRAEPLRLVLGRLLAHGGRLVVPMRVAFPERTAADEEPLLSWGPVEGYDVLWARAASPGVFVFSLDTVAARAAPPRRRPASAGVGFVPGRFYDLSVDVDRVRRRVTVSVDGRERFALDGRLVPVVSRHVWPGRGPRGHGAPDLGHFSGTLIPEDMWLAGPPGLHSLPTISADPALLTPPGSPAPTVGAAGRLWAIAGHRGAYLSTGDSWRWIPAATLDRVELSRTLRLEASSSGPLEPVLVSGGLSGADALVVRRRGGGPPTVALARWDGVWRPGAESAPLPATASGGGELEATLDRPARRVVVAFDGHEVLRASVDLETLRPEDLLIGDTPRGMAFTERRPAAAR